MTFLLSTGAVFSLTAKAVQLERRTFQDAQLRHHDRGIDRICDLRAVAEHRVREVSGGRIADLKNSRNQRSSVSICIGTV